MLSTILSQRLWDRWRHRFIATRETDRAFCLMLYCLALWQIPGCLSRSMFSLPIYYVLLHQKTTCTARTQYTKDVWTCMEALFHSCRHFNPWEDTILHQHCLPYFVAMFQSTSGSTNFYELHCVIYWLGLGECHWTTRVLPWIHKEVGIGASWSVLFRMTLWLNFEMLSRASSWRHGYKSCSFWSQGRWRFSHAS